MPRRRIIDPSKLIDAVEEGRVDREVMDQFGLESPHKKQEKGQAKRRYTRRFITKKPPDPDEPDETISVNERGSLIIPKDMIGAFGFLTGDHFIIRKTKAGIHLRRADEED